MLILLLSIGLLLCMVAPLGRSQFAMQRQLVTEKALARAKQGLLAWTYARGSNPASLACPATAGGDPRGECNDRPGELPCPDLDAPGTAGYGTAEGTCVAGAIGRLPWRTLGLGELHDGDGEPLWYALDGSFRWRWSRWNHPINSDTRASLQAYAADGSSLLTTAGNEAAALVFAVGAPLSGQLRDAAHRTDASQYLDRAHGHDNAHVGGPFVQGPSLDRTGQLLANDRLLVLGRDELLHHVSGRVAQALSDTLVRYVARHDRYPHPAAADDPSCQLHHPDEGLPGACAPNPTLCRGRLPSSPTLLDSTQAPEWLSWNLWHQAVYYGTSTRALDAGHACGRRQSRAGASLAPCTGSLAQSTTEAQALAACSSSLTVDTHRSALALLVLPGASRGAADRTGSGTLADYLDDVANQDGWSSTLPGADDYVTPRGRRNQMLTME